MNKWKLTLLENSGIDRVTVGMTSASWQSASSDARVVLNWSVIADLTLHLLVLSSSAKLNWEVSYCLFCQLPCPQFAVLWARLILMFAKCTIKWLSEMLLIINPPCPFYVVLFLKNERVKKYLMIVPPFWGNVVCVRSPGDVGPLVYAKIMDLVEKQDQNFDGHTVLCWQHRGGTEQQVTHWCMGLCLH